MKNKVSNAVKAELCKLAGFTNEALYPSAVISSVKEGDLRRMTVRINTSGTIVSEVGGGVIRIQDISGALNAARLVQEDQITGVRDDGTTFPVDLTAEEKARYLNLAQRAFKTLDTLS